MALPLFAVTLFVSAFILFLVQPMVGKMILPKLGGTPQVWNTCMVFFQTALLAGYAYTHTSTTRFPFRRQLVVHGLLLLIPFIVLLPPLGPFNFESWTPPLGGNPVFSTLWILTLLVGIPFFVVATSAPLLQRWFVHTGHPAAKDPYFLYGASNLGSLLALLAYPAIIEPFFGLRVEQPWTWTVLYVFLGILVAACAAMVWKSPPLVEMPGTETVPSLEALPPAQPPTPELTTAVKPVPAGSIARKKFGKGKATFAPTAAPVQAAEDIAIRPDVMTTWRRLRWVLLAAAPSSLMLGVTTYICTDLSPIPLLWVVPLALYLLTFILVFARWPVVWVGLPHKVVLFLQPVLVLGLCLVLINRSFSPIWPTIIALTAFFATALTCHGELARDRPSPKHLTEFYLWMSVGGMVGGMFNGLFAPIVFTGVVEFPLAIVLGCFLRPQQRGDGWTESSLGSLFPNMIPYFRDKGDELAKSYNKPEPRSTYVLNYTLDIILPVLLAAGAFFLLYYATGSWGWRNRLQYNPLFKFWKAMGLGAQAAAEFTPLTYNVLVNGLPMVLCFFFAGRPVRFGLGVALLLIAHLGYQAAHEEKTVYAGRSYFGVLRVRETEDSIGTYTSLMHGTTHHGLNYQSPNKYRRMATTYYHQYGPAGMVMKQYNWFNDGYVGNGPKEWLADMLKYSSDARLPTSLIGLGVADLASANLPLVPMIGLWSEPPYATIGLGTGTMASYGRPFQHVHYYEIDNKIRLLNLPEDGTEPFFNYLTEAKKRGAEVQVRMGDARLRMAFDYAPYNEKNEQTGENLTGGGPDNFYHMMVVDAFSSDAIPIHLITKEAIEMYFRKLTPDGILCVHTSNRHVDLVPVVEAVARSIKKLGNQEYPDGLVCKRGHDNSPYSFPGHFTSEWVMVARNEDVFKGNGKHQGLTAPKGYTEALKQKYRDEGYSDQVIDTRLLEDYWKTPARQLAYPWTDDYSNVLGVFRWR